MRGAYIKAGRKADARAIASTDNSVNNSSKRTNQYIDLANLAFVAFAAANYAGNSNLAILEKTCSGTTTSTSDEFFAIFATFANITLKKNQICINLIHFYLPLTINRN